MTAAIKVENLCKRYRLGLTHAGSVRELVNGAVSRLISRSSKKPSPPATDSDRVTPDGHFWAVRDVSFEIQPGEVVGIIGRNGAGKSTLLKLLSRITMPTEGRIELRGRVASLLEVGTGFHPELTGRENVYMNGTILGMTKREIDAQFDAIVDFSGIEKFIDTPVKRYSSGMTVRLGFAVAAHLDPEILIVDEVLAVGDVEFQRRCLSRMQSVADSGKTVLFVSHNLASIRSLTSRTIVLSAGRRIFDGPTDDGVSTYVAENVSSASSYGSVEQIARPFSGLDRKLEFVDLKLLTLGDNTYIEGQVFKIQAKIRANDTTLPFVVGLSIYSEDKTVIGSSFSEVLTPPNSGLVASYDLEALLPLSSGRYHCSVSISEQRSGGRGLHDSLADILPFEVSHDISNERRWNSAWGAVQLPLLRSSKSV